jgi:hypothetical protein
MPPRTVSPDYISGEVHALLMFALAAANAHPDRDLLAQHFYATSQQGLARLEATTVSDKTVDGFQFVVKRILDQLR